MQKASNSPPRIERSAPALLVTADDRTGALEAGAACADLGFAVRLAASPAPDDDCAVVDIDSRHRSPDDAKRRVVQAHRHPARGRCHKMDSSLRGNWAHEVAALLAAGWRVGVLASFPAAGRRSKGGVVTVHGVPVAQGAGGTDPRNPVRSSRPAEHLASAGCGAALAAGDVVVLDASEDDELRAAARRCRDEHRMLVGTTGAIGAFAGALYPERAASAPPLPRLPRPALIACGSLHPLSRAQIAALDCPRFGLDAGDAALAALAQGADVVVATPQPRSAIDDDAAESMARRMAATVHRLLAASGAPALAVLGGDTAAAILGDRVLKVYGSIDTALPLCTDGELAIVTKGGGIGAPDTLARLLARAPDSPPRG